MEDVDEVELRLDVEGVEVVLPGANARYAPTPAIIRIIMIITTAIVVETDRLSTDLNCLRMKKSRRIATI